MGLPAKWLKLEKISAFLQIWKPTHIYMVKFQNDNVKQTEQKVNKQKKICRVLKKNR